GRAEIFLILLLASKAEAGLVRARRIAMPSRAIDHFGKRGLTPSLSPRLRPLRYLRGCGIAKARSKICPPAGPQDGPGGLVGQKPAPSACTRLELHLALTGTRCHRLALT